MTHRTNPLQTNPQPATSGNSPANRTDSGDSNPWRPHKTVLAMRNLSTIFKLVTLEQRIGKVSVQSNSDSTEMELLSERLQKNLDWYGTGYADLNSVITALEKLPKAVTETNDTDFPTTSIQPDDLKIIKVTQSFETKKNGFVVTLKSGRDFQYFDGSIKVILDCAKRWQQNDPSRPEAGQEQEPPAKKVKTGSTLSRSISTQASRVRQDSKELSDYRSPSASTPVVETMASILKPATSITKAQGSQAPQGTNLEKVNRHVSNEEYIGALGNVSGVKFSPSDINIFKNSIKRLADHLKEEQKDIHDFLLEIGNSPRPEYHPTVIKFKEKADADDKYRSHMVNLLLYIFQNKFYDKPATAFEFKCKFLINKPSDFLNP